MQGKRPLTDSEIKIIAKKGFKGRYAARDRCIFHVGWTTGFRCSEIRQLRVHNVFGKKSVLSEITAEANTTKGSAAGNVKKTLPPARDAIQKWIDKREQLYYIPSRSEDYNAWKQSYLFPSQRQGCLSVKQVWVILKTAFANAGVEGAVATHSLRKTYAKKAYYNYLKRYRDGKTDTEPMRLLQLALGHKHIDTTYRYMSFISEEIDEEAFAIDAL